MLYVLLESINLMLAIASDLVGAATIMVDPAIHAGGSSLRQTIDNSSALSKARYCDHIAFLK